MSTGTWHRTRHGSCAWGFAFPSCCSCRAVRVGSLLGFTSVRWEALAIRQLRYTSFQGTKSFVINTHLYQYLTSGKIPHILNDLRLPVTKHAETAWGRTSPLALKLSHALFRSLFPAVLTISSIIQENLRASLSTAADERWLPSEQDRRATRSEQQPGVPDLAISESSTSAAEKRCWGWAMT